MSTIIESSGSGVDLNTFNTTELMLVSLLKAGRTYIQGQTDKYPVYASIGLGYAGSGYTWDFSTIQSIVIQSDPADTRSYSGHLQLCLGSNTAISGATKLSFEMYQDLQSVTATCNIPEAWRVPNLRWWLHTEIITRYISLVSFTTTDGKVHTADNLNY